MEGNVLSLQHLSINGSAYPQPQQQPPLQNAPNGPAIPGQQPGNNPLFPPGPQMQAYPQPQQPPLQNGPAGGNNPQFQSGPQMNTYPQPPQQQPIQNGPSGPTMGGQQPGNNPMFPPGPPLNAYQQPQQQPSLQKRPSSPAIATHGQQPGSNTSFQPGPQVKAYQQPPLQNAPNGPAMAGQLPGNNPQFSSGPQMQAYQQPPLQNASNGPAMAGQQSGNNPQFPPGPQIQSYQQPQQKPLQNAPVGPTMAGQQPGNNPTFPPGPQTNAYPQPQQQPPLPHAPNGPAMPGQLPGINPQIQPGPPQMRYPTYPQPQQQPPLPRAPVGPAMPGQQPGNNPQFQSGPQMRYPAYPQPQQQPPLPHAPNGPAMPGQQPGFNPQFQPGPQMNAYQGQQPFSGPPGAGQPGQMPPGPGGQPNYPSYGPTGTGGTPAYPQPTQQQSQKRLDPDQMPSAIAVMQEDQQNRGGIFITNQKGLLPPLVTTKFQVDDQGNASPRYVRSTMYSVPALPDMLKQTAIPFALIVNPFESPARDEQPLSVVDLGAIGPVRCIRCKAYMSPLMQFIDGGRRFQCLLCKATTEVPPEYFQHLDHTGQRLDKWERPELMKGSYEFVATTEYCRNNVLPKEPAFVFVIDVSYNNVKSGLVHLLCAHIKNLVEVLPPQTPVGFITYNSKVHFYNIDPTLAQPQMVIVPDIGDMFMPLLTGFLVPRGEATSSIEALMEQIPSMFADTKETEAVLGPAITAGMEALKASERAGKLLVFNSSLPTSDVAPGKLKNREADRKLLGTEKEKTILTPQSTYYNNLGQDCVGVGVSVDLYLFNNSYIDVATIGQVARITGGSVNKYTYFQADIDGPRVIGELHYHLSRPIGFDGVMRVRTSTGVRPVDFFGHYYMANTTDVDLAAIDSQKSIAIEIKHDDKLTDEDGVYIQIALLYTSISGQRRLRIHNIALTTCLQMADLYRNCELDTIINFLAKQGISKSVDSTPQALKDGVISRCAQMLATYRKHCANPSMPGQLILPECLKLLPLYTNCILRSDAVAGTAELTPDDRSWLMYTIMTLGVSNSVHYFYPQLIPITGPNVTLDDPAPVRCSKDKMSDEFAFLLENGIYIFMWIGNGVSPEWLQNIFGVSNLSQINVEKITELPDHVNSDESLRLRALIRSLRSERQRHMRLTLVRQRDKMEAVMNRFLVEDRGAEGQPSYVDFLCHMHKEIRSLLNQ